MPKSLRSFASSSQSPADTEIHRRGTLGHSSVYSSTSGRSFWAGCALSWVAKSCRLGPRASLLFGPHLYAMLRHNLYGGHRHRILNSSLGVRDLLVVLGLARVCSDSE